MRGKRIKIYWLQFVTAAVWVGVAEVLLYNRVSVDIRRFAVDILILLTGILAFEPFGKHIFKYLIVCFGASFIIQLLRRFGRWFISEGSGLGGLGGPLVALIAITVIMLIVGGITNRDKVDF